MKNKNDLEEYFDDELSAIKRMSKQNKVNQKQAIKFEKRHARIVKWRNKRKALGKKLKGIKL